MNSEFQRIVHFDLKGAPWTAVYLAKVIEMAKKWGATGILFEWEDTFPFIDELTIVGSLGGSNKEGLYALSEIQYLLQFVKDNGLIPIQLIQTIGHMEYVLKHGQFTPYRELSHSPAVLCPTRNGSRTLVQNMITQILEVQPDAKYIHIGADEAWHMNICSDCRAKSENHQFGPMGLYLEHVSNIATFIKAKYPSVTILMWDDMLRSLPSETLRVFNLGTLVQPVVWNYCPEASFSFDIAMWARYSHVFSKVWVGSAFKGANGSCQIMSPVGRYVSNQVAWIEELKIYEEEMSFGGVILTGWSRFDHYATLCELLPVSLPSLASCLRLWTKPEDVPTEEVIMEVLPSEEWPGEDVARSIHTFISQREKILTFLNGDLVLTWMNPWQIEHNYTNPLQLEGVAGSAKQLLTNLTSILNTMKMNQSSIMGPRSSAEWCATWGTTLARKLQKIIDIATDSNRAIASVTPASDKRRPCE